MWRWQFIPEPDLVPYRPVDSLPAAGLLVLAPHPDDEVFGCGGTVARACDAACPVTIVVATDGSKGGDAAVRQAESRRAVAVLAGSGALPSLHFWDWPDRELRPDAALVERIRGLLLTAQPGWLLAPSPFEVHPDHRALCLAAIEAARGHPVELLFFEIGQPLMANRFVDISAVMARKRAAMACFESQLGSQHYDQQVEALNRLRSYTLGPAVDFAEALWCPRSDGPLGVPDVLADATRRLARHLGLDPA